MDIKMQIKRIINSSFLSRCRYSVYLRYILVLFVFIGLSLRQFSNVVDCTTYNTESKLTYPIVIHTGSDHNATSHYDVTIVTHLNTERLYMLESLVHHWPGPLVAAVYGNSSELSTLGTALRKLHRPGVVFKLVLKRGTLYPINFLRNVAIKHCRSKYMLMLDVDFMPSPDLYEDFHSFLRNSILSQIDRRVAAIIPAFATNQSQAPIPRNKEELIQQWETRETLPYSEAIAFKNGHDSTNFAHWRNANKHYELPLGSLHNRFEPYLIIERDISPAYNATFIQRFFDKSSYIEALKHSGFHFMVLPNSFVIHRPHPTATKQKQNEILPCAKEARRKYLLWLLRQDPLFYMET